MAVELSSTGKIVRNVLIAGLIFGAGYFVTTKTNLLAPPATQTAKIPQVLTLPDQPAPVVNTPVEPQSTPTTVANIPTSDNPIKIQILPWNAELGLILANGGPSTTKDSLFGQSGLNVTIERQNDYSVMKSELVQCGTQFSQGTQYPDKACLVVIMGDGSPDFIVGPNESLANVGTSLKGVGAFGLSQGEDKCMLPYAVANDPSKARGMTIAAVPRDGDIQTCLPWLARNNIAFNPDPMTWDPDALNIWATDTYEQAAQAYINGVTQERPVVRDGKITTEKHLVKADGAAVWTPADVTIAKQKGGLIAVSSTASQGQKFQMPAMLIGPDNWLQAHKDEVQAILNGGLKSGDRIRASNAMLNKAAEYATQVWKEQNAAYWAKYYKGTVEKDAQGHEVQLGGSLVFNLNDNIHLFGLDGQSMNIFGQVYEYYRQFNLDNYTSTYPNGIPNVSEFLDTSYLKALVDKNVVSAPANMPTYTKGVVTQVEGRKAEHIEFDVGSASIRQDVNTQKALKDILDLTIATGLKIELAGHTDKTGSPAKNLVLSKQRAQAVKQWLQAQSPADYPNERFSKIEGFGSSKPVDAGDTKEALQTNRRVDLVTGQ